MGARTFRVLVSEYFVLGLRASVRSSQSAKKKTLVQLGTLPAPSDAASRPISVACVPRVSPEETHPVHVPEGPRRRQRHAPEWQ